MTNTTKKWKTRVEGWRASEKSSRQYSKGRGFTAGGLRYWAHRLRREHAEGCSAPPPAVRLARVIRAPLSSPPTAAAPVQGAPVAEAARLHREVSAPSKSLVLETRGVSIGVPPGFDPTTLATVLDVLERRLTAGRKR